MSFALPRQSKNNAAGIKTSTAAKHYSSTHNHINNLKAKDSPETILYLQRASSNQAVQRIMHSNIAGFDFANISIFQPKLKVSQPEDEYEQEAGKVAQVMRMSISDDSVVPMMSTKEEDIDRNCAACKIKEEEEDKVNINTSRKAVSNAPEATNEITNEINDIRSRGSSSLDAGTKKFMEFRFGYDFSNVRIHADERSARSANSIRALAYTVGNDIVFGKGQYNTSTIEGKRLVAHELAHIVQQQGETVDRRNGKLAFEPSSSLFEREAEQAAEHAITGENIMLSRILPSGSVARVQRAEHGTYVSTQGERQYIDAGERFYRTWGHPNVRRVSNMIDVLNDLDRARGTIDRFRIVSHGSELGLQLGLLPEVSPGWFGEEAAEFITERRFREVLIDKSLVSEDFFNRIYNEMLRNNATAMLLATIGAGNDVPTPESPLGILLRAMVDQRFLADVELDTGGRAPIANRAQLERFNVLRMNTYGILVRASAPRDKQNEVRAAIESIRRNLPAVMASAGLSFEPLTLEESRRLAEPFVESTGRGTHLKAELTKSIREGAGGPYLNRLRSVKRKISDRTHIEIRGCNVGSNSNFLDSMRGYFGRPEMLPSISAPDLYQYFFQLGFETYPSSPDLEARLEAAFADLTTGLARSFEDLARMKAGEIIRVVNESSLSELAAKYGFNAGEVRKLNPEITDPDHLNPGDVVWLKQRTNVPAGIHKKLSDFCRDYLGDENALPRVMAANTWLRDPSNLQPHNILQLPRDVLRGPVAMLSPTAREFISEMRRGTAVTGLSTDRNQPILHMYDPLRAEAVGEWLAKQNFDPTGRTALELSRRYRRRFGAAMRNTYIQFLSRSYPNIEDPIFPEDPRYAKHIIQRP
jgi:hypothetical protein